MLLSIITLLLTLFNSGSGLVKTPPLFVCDGKLGDVNTLVPSCTAICKIPENVTSPSAYQLYESVTTLDSYVAKCTRVRASRVFSESYLFTRSKSEVSKIYPSPILENCTNIFKGVCGLKACNPQEPKFKEDYTWGKHVNETLDYHIVMASLITITISIDSTFNILLNKESVPVSDGHYRPPLENAIYLWDKELISDVKQCPFEKSNDVIGCYEEVDQVWCPDLGIYLDTVRMLNDSRCSEEVFLSSSGTLYTKTTSPINTNHEGVIPIPADSSKESMALIASVNSWLYRRDRSACLTSCLTSREPGMHIIGQQSLLTTGEYFAMCSKTVSCRLISPVTICGKPILVRVMCGAGQYWWNPKFEYVEPTTECESLLSKLPSVEYTAGVLRINRTGVFYLPAEFMTNIPGNFRGYIKVESWLSHAKDTRLEFSPHPGFREGHVETSRSTSIEENENWLGKAWNKISDIPRFVSDKFHEVEDWVKTTSVVIVCGAAGIYLLWKVCRTSF